MLRRRRWLTLAGAAVFVEATPARADIPRLARIRKRAQPRVEDLFAAAGVSYPPKQMLLRSFKHEDEFEVWAASKGDEPLTLIKRYPICAKSGVLGPKRRQGDLQVPEGRYHIHRFNAWSAYHLSLRVDYPNASDKVRGRKWGLGGAIMVHGDCVTIGCIPIENRPIEEVFIAVIDTHRHNRRKVPIDIFPARMDENGMKLLKSVADGDDTLASFWRELEPIYRHFEENRTIPDVVIEPKTGRYMVAAPGAPRT